MRTFETVMVKEKKTNKQLESNMPMQCVDSEVTGMNFHF